MDFENLSRKSLLPIEIFETLFAQGVRMIILPLSGIDEIKFISQGGSNMLNKVRFFILFLISVILVGCAGVTVHDDLNVAPGKIEGNQFTGIRYPFKVEVPQGWKMAREFPDFLKEMGYEE